MRLTTSKLLANTFRKLKLLLSLVFACIFVSACSSGGGDGSSSNNSQSVQPNPYANGYRVVQVIKTFLGEPYSVDDYAYDQEKSTITWSKTRDDATSSKIQKLNSAGLIIQSVTPAEDNLLSDNDRTWEYSYNANGQLASRKDLSGFPVIRYIRDERGNLTKLDGIIPFEYNYDANGQLESTLDTVRLELHVFEYNAARQLSGGVTTSNDGSAFGRFEVLYDQNGNISQVTGYNRWESPIFSDTYVYEKTDAVVVNHALMRLLNELPELTNTAY